MVIYNNQKVRSASNAAGEEDGKVYLLLVTIIYCVIIQVLDIGPGPAIGIYLIVLGFVKGYLSEELEDVFNFKKTKYLYNKIKFKDSLMELLSLILIYINSCLLINEPISLFEFVYLFVGFAMVFRFIFWGITRTIRIRY